jgi:glycosyltransferase involved in cell wall biosynthesis
MRVLFVTPRFPGAAARGDQTRSWQQLRQLAPRHSITLLTCEAPDASSPACVEVLRLCERVHVLPRARIAAAWSLLRAGITSRPLQTALYDAWPAADALAAVLGEGQFDLVHVQMARLAGVFERLAPLPRVLDLVDALSLNMARRATLDRGPTRWIAGREAARLERLEQLLCGQASAIAISAEPDLQRLIGAGASDRVPSAVVANGVDPDDFPYTAQREPSARIVFGANLGYFPNVDAALWFTGEVLPRVRQRVPEATLQLVGARPARVLHLLAARERAVQLVGPVPHMHPWLAQAAVAISPLRAGSGMQLKVLEAMASGTPLVASTASAAALDAQSGRHLLVADDAATMADAVVDTLVDSLAARQRAEAAHALVLERYTWAQAADRLESLWQRALSAAAG